MELMLTADNMLPIAQENSIVEIENQLVKLKEMEKALREALEEELSKRNIKKLETAKLTITYVDETTKETFDSKQFKADHRDLYNDYCRISDVKAHVVIKVKNGNVEN